MRSTRHISAVATRAKMRSKTMYSYAAANQLTASTGEDLGSFWFWDTPSNLLEAIKGANGGILRGWLGE